VRGSRDLLAEALDIVGRIKDADRRAPNMIKDDQVRQRGAGVRDPADDLRLLPD
jgi:hypothetical protein